jgi:hypothetical protein
MSQLIAYYTGYVTGFEKIATEPFWTKNRRLIALSSQETTSYKSPVTQSAKVLIGAKNGNYSGEQEMD